MCIRDRYKLNVCVGDSWPAPTSGYWKVIEKYDLASEKDTITWITIAYYEHGEEWPFYTYLQEGLGLFYYSGELVYYGLVGYCINGIVWGDTTITCVKQTSEDLLLEAIILHQNYPNPFNPATEIRYQLSEARLVNLEIYNLLGQKIRTLIDGQQPATSHTIRWDGRDETGAAVSSGVYLYTLTAGRFCGTRKMVVIR